MHNSNVVIDTNKLQRLSGQLGSNPAGVYVDTHGQRYYIKTLESQAHARNEFIAAKLYQLAGAPTLSYIKTSEVDQIATKWITLDKKCVKHLNSSERLQAKQWFGVHAWTANWDVAGYDGDNQGVINNSVITLDVGGALSFRAMGDPKGSAFANNVDELTQLRSDPDNPHAVTLFGDMSHEQLKQAIKVVSHLSDQQIQQVITDNLGSIKLVAKMIARKNYMVTVGKKSIS